MVQRGAALAYNNVIFICSGNTCRSPMAQAWLQHYWPGQSVYSAGVHAKPNTPISTHALKVLRQYNILWEGTSQLFDANTVGQHDLLLVMTKAHHTLVTAALLACNVRNKTLPLVMLLGVDEEIADPYGKSLQDYEACFLHIKMALQKHRGKFVI